MTFLNGKGSLYDPGDTCRRFEMPDVGFYRADQQLFSFISAGPQSPPECGCFYPIADYRPRAV